MKNVIYIDTRPGESIFAAPKGEPNYTAWLKNRYKKQQYKDGEHACCFGLAQKIHAMLQAKKPPIIITAGPHAQQIAKFLLLLASKLNKKICVEVING